LINSTKELFSNVEKYLQGEITATSEDYKLLETMNNMTKEKYVDMTNTAHGLVEYMTLLQQKYTEFQPYLNKIDEIETSVNELEKTVALLDQYTLRLGKRTSN
jgi:biogenesis of lysosome-related organelles complex 1 subunit 2